MGKPVVRRSQKIETLQMKQAWLQYWAMGEERSLSRLSEGISVPLSTLERWSADHKWQERIQKQDEKVHRAMMAKYGQEAVETRGKMLKVVDKTLDVFLARLENGTAGQITVSDMEKIMKFGMLLHGGPTQRVEENHNHQGVIQHQMPTQRDKLEELRRNRGLLPPSGGQDPPVIDI